MTTIEIRRATAGDIESIAALLADDSIGAGRESPADLAPYRAAFAAVDADSSEMLVVGERDGQVVATLQLSVIPGLSRRGALRGQIEGVRVAASERGGGFGATLIEWAIDEARRRGCDIVQLTSDKARTDAHRFYDRLGFQATHEGYKMSLDPTDAS